MIKVTMELASWPHTVMRHHLYSHHDTFLSGVCCGHCVMFHVWQFMSIRINVLFCGISTYNIRNVSTSRLETRHWTNAKPWLAKKRTNIKISSNLWQQIPHKSIKQHDIPSLCHCHGGRDLMLSWYDYKSYFLIGGNTLFTAAQKLAVYGIY